jgi:PAS domain-containing protein
MQRALGGEPVIFNRQTIEGPNAGKWVRAHYFPLPVDGSIGGVLVVLVDIQQLKDTEAELAVERKQLQLVVDNIGVPMSYIDRDWRFRFANQPGADWMIPDTAQAIGRRVDEMLGPDAMQVIRARRSRPRSAARSAPTSAWRACRTACSAGCAMHLVPTGARRR